MERERPIQKKIYVNEEENEIIKQKMKQAKINNFSRLVREFILTGEVKVITFEEIRELIFEVKKIGININQIIKLANTRKEISENEIREVIKQQEILNKNMVTLINKFMKNGENKKMKKIIRKGAVAREKAEAKKEALEDVKENGLFLKFISDELKDDKDVVMQAVKDNAYALQYASERLKDDEDVVFEAMEKNTLAFRFASDRLKSLLLAVEK